MLLATDWTPVLVTLVATIPSTLAVVFTFLIRREQQTPSGDPIGEVVERTHDLAAANSLALRQQAEILGKSDSDRRP